MNRIILSGDVLSYVVAGLLICCGIVALLLWRLRRRLRRAQQRLLEQAAQGNALGCELAGIATAIAALASRFDRLSAQLTIDARHLSGGATIAQRDVEFALRGVRQGASEDELVGEYGMSRQEAVLLRRLHATPVTLPGRCANA